MSDMLKDYDFHDQYLKILVYDKSTNQITIDVDISDDDDNIRSKTFKFSEVEILRVDDGYTFQKKPNDIIGEISILEHIPELDKHEKRAIAIIVLIYPKHKLKQGEYQPVFSMEFLTSGVDVH